MSNSAKKVFVGLSGGVDSSVSAALLKKAGYKVTGVFIHVWNPASEQGPTFFPIQGRTLFGLCEAADDRLDAMRVCAKLNIPFVELNLEKEYKKEVVDYMIREYRAGKTPNPDVFCNRFIKFGGFYKWALANGADFIATGHYARIEEAQSTVHKDQTKHKTQDPKLNVKRYTLNVGSDPNKDQSYFLWQIRKEQLPYILFPVGGMKKPAVRKLAKKFGLITADKKDSQGLCFVGKVDMKEFLSHYIKPKRGDILLAADERGLKRGLTRMKKVGEHNGAVFYTIGERIGDFTRSDLVSGKRSDLVPGPYYIVAKDVKRNTFTVSPKSPDGTLGGAATRVAIKDCNWLTKPIPGKTYQARIRYRQPLQSCHIANTYGRKYSLLFEEPQVAAPGQSLVLYDGEVCLGGGIIE